MTRPVWTTIAITEWVDARTQVEYWFRYYIERRTLESKQVVLLTRLTSKVFRWSSAELFTAMPREIYEAALFEGDDFRRRVGGVPTNRRERSPFRLR